MITMSRLLLLFTILLLASCEKFRKDPELELTSAKIAEDGSVQLKAAITKRSKHVKEIGFCFGISSQPEASYYESSNPNEGKKKCEFSDFSLTLPEKYFESYKTYYFRPYTITTDNEVVYGETVHFDNVQKPFATPACFLQDNEVNLGSGFPTEYFSSVEETLGDDHMITATSGSYSFEVKFLQEVKTGTYKTDGILDQEPDEIWIRIENGSTSAIMTPGTTVYVNEISKDKYEIIGCDAPWKVGNTTYYSDFKIIVNP